MRSSGERLSCGARPDSAEFDAFLGQQEVLRVKLINQSDESRDIIQIERHFLSFSLQRLLHLTEVSVFYLKCAFQMCPSLLSIIY